MQYLGKGYKQRMSTRAHTTQAPIQEFQHI